MKITFIQPRYFNIWEALGIGYLASRCRREVPGIDIGFFQSYFDDDGMVLDGCGGSDYVAFSCTSPAYRHGEALAREVKRRYPSCRTIVGGNHASAVPDDVSDAFDFVVVGEGEGALVDILSGRGKERVIGSPPTEFRSGEWPDRDVILNRRTVDLCERVAGIRSMSFLAHRGCPFRCRYCAEHAVSGFGRIRTRDIDDALDEIEKCSIDHRLDFFKFADATFDVSAEWVSEFCDRKEARGNRLAWECMIHANCATRDMMHHLKSANCRQINVGCESGSDRILKAMNKGVTRKKIVDVFDWAREAGLERRAFFIVGMPEETPEDIAETDDLVGRIDPEVFGVTMLCPYPGSSLYDPARHSGVDWSATDEYGNDFWRTDRMTNLQLKEAQGLLTDKYHNKLNLHQRGLMSNEHN